MRYGLRVESSVGGAGRLARGGSRTRLVGSLLLGLAIVIPLLSGCAGSAKSQATKNKAKLDAELHTASVTAGVPARRLAPLIAQENALDANTASGSNSAYQAAANGYDSLYKQVVTLEKMTPSQAQMQASSDLTALQSALTATEGAGIADVTTAAKRFDATVPQAQQRLAAAKTSQDYFAVDGYILDQSAAVTLMLPDYQQIQALSKLVTTQTANLAPKPGSAHVLQCAEEGGELAGFGIVPAQFWTAQNAYPVAASNPVMATPQAPTETYFFSRWPAQALAAFKAAQTADDYAALNVELRAEIGTLTADTDPKALAHDQVAATVARFQAQVNTYQNDVKASNDFLKQQQSAAPDVPDDNAVWSMTNSTQGFAPPKDFYSKVPAFTVDGKYAQEAAQDAKTLAAAQSAADLTALTKTVAQQEQDMTYAYLKVAAFYDTNIALRALVNQGQSTTTDVTYLGTLYKTPNAYEYADDDLRYDPRDTVGIEDAEIRYDQSVYREGFVSSSDAQADYQAVEDEAQMFIHNLTANITNLAQMPKDDAARKAWSMTAHQTDSDLINYYGLQNTRVVIVSLREQKARLYENGKLVTGSDGQPYAFDVTTGSPDKPTVPGIHCAMPPLKGPPGGDIFKSADPPGSPFYYAPTPVHYSFGYSLYGYYMHDGWWRDATEMGYLTNLPHYDPEAFNGGSHGCINFHYANGDMGKVYAFSSPGIPIVVY